jgi:hypothetical protein
MVYPRKELVGGARPDRSSAGWAGLNKLKAGITCRHSLFKIKQHVVPANAGEVCHFQSDGLSLLAWRIVRLMPGASSIQSCMAQTSSVAEITGKRTTSIHPRASRQWDALSRWPGTLLASRQSQYAGSVKRSHARLRTSSTAGDTIQERSHS